MLKHIKNSFFTRKDMPFENLENISLIYLWGISTFENLENISFIFQISS